MKSNVHTTLTVCTALLVAAMFGDLVAAPVQETKGGVTVVHGGVNADDRALVEQQAADHNLKLTFARKGSGAYLADVKVVVRNKQGTVVIDTVASGPLLLARLPEVRGFEVFGETLHVWGVGEGPYVELPVLGPSTGRDAGPT